jgi:hypothetical protein
VSKKNLKLSVSVFALLATIAIPDHSFAHGGKRKLREHESLEDERFRNKSHRANTSSDGQEKGVKQGHPDAINISGLPIPNEILFHILSWCDASQVKLVCNGWRDVVTKHSPTLLTEYSKAQKKVEDARSAAQHQPSENVTEAEEAVSALLRGRQPLHALFRFLEEGRQNDLIYNRDHFVPFMRRAMAQRPDPSPILARLLSHYPRVFHAFRAPLLEELSNASERLKESNESYVWEGNLLPLLSPEKQGYLLENPPVFKKLAPFFVREIKKQDNAASLCWGLSGDVYNILLPYFDEFFKTADDFKKYFLVLTQDPLTFAYLRPILEARLHASEEYRMVVGEMPYPALPSTVFQTCYASPDVGVEEFWSPYVRSSINTNKISYVKLKSYLAIHSLQEACGNETSKKELAYFMGLFDFNDKEKWPYGFLHKIFLTENFGELDYVQLCFYSHHDWRPLVYDFWDACRNKTKRFVEVMRHLQRYAAIIQRFVMAAKNVPEYRSKDSRVPMPFTSSYFSYTKNYSTYPDLFNIKILILKINADAMKSCDGRDALLILHQFSKNSLFTQANSLMRTKIASRFDHGYYCTRDGYIDPVGLVWDDAQLYLLDSTEHFENIINRLTKALSDFQDQNLSLSEDKLIAKEDVVFLKACFETCIHTLTVEGLFEKLLIRLKDVHSYFLAPHDRENEDLADQEGIEEDEDVRDEGSIGEDEDLPDQEKYFYQQDTLSWFLQVLTRLGYDSVQPSTKDRIVQIFKYYLLLAHYDVNDVREFLSSSYDDWKEAFTRFLFLHDPLLNRIFKEDEEARTRHQQMRLDLGVDLYEEGEEGEGEGEGEGKGKGEDPTDRSSKEEEEVEMEVEE